MIFRIVTCLLFTLLFSVYLCIGQANETPQYGMYEITLDAKIDSSGLFPLVVFTQPDGGNVSVEGFYDGEGKYKARAYCHQKGTWKWKIKARGFKRASGKFKVVDSTLKGKLRIHPKDSYQFAYDNGDWFLHIGDTGYRYLTDTEPYWKEYIDQSVKMGATKIRAWFCRSRNNVEALFDARRNNLDYQYWQEIDKRISYAYKNYPNVVLQLIPFGEDTEELKRYEAGDNKSLLLVRYAQARFSAYPNILWCISNDREIVDNNTDLTGRQVHHETINQIGHYMNEHEPWGTLISNHQSRFKGYSFTHAKWSDFVTLEDLDQIDGRIIAKYRSFGLDPVVNDEDRYEKYREPDHPRYFFRRLMWASLLSGGHATYGGAKSFEVFTNEDALTGVRGYYDIGLEGGNDFQYIHQFFAESGLDLVNMKPDDELTGSDPQRFKSIHNGMVYIIYLANPDKVGQPETSGNKSADIRSANQSLDIPSVTIDLTEDRFLAKWYDPSSGKWFAPSEINGGVAEITAPGSGDWVLLLTKK